MAGSSDEFARCLKKVLVHEGGFVDHPKDPGGATNKGVTFRVYNGYRKRKGLPQRSVKFISDAEVADIYRELYWNKIRGDELPSGVSYILFDGAVNSGPTQSVKWAQRALGLVADGNIGPATIEALTSRPDNDALIAAMVDRRFAFLRALKTWSTFGKGWSRRVNDVRAVGQAWASGSVGPDPVWTAEGAKKALLEDRKVVPLKASVAALGGSGGATAVISQITDQLTPIATSLPSIGTVITVLTAFGSAIAIGSLLYSRWAAAKEKELDDALDANPVGVPA
jgi:lysozyme family protein